MCFRKFLPLLCCAGFMFTICVAKNVQTFKTFQFDKNNHKTIQDNSWLTQMSDMRRELWNCAKLERSIWQCVKEKTLNVFEKFLNADSIKIFDGVRLIRRPESVSSINSIDDNITHAEERKDYKYLNWFEKLALRLAKTLETHTLQINLAQLTKAHMDAMDKRDSTSYSTDVGTARLRRHRYNMIITMMFGVTALGAVLVPVGFQILSIVSGKALLLAKMALLLASVNGLKRVANTGLHYGLYHVPHEQLGYYDRGDVNHPRNVPLPLPVPVTPPLEFGLK